MRRPNPLPGELHGQVFSRAQARALGVTDDRLRSRDITRLAHAIYRHRPLGPTAEQETKGVAPVLEDPRNDAYSPGGTYGSWGEELLRYLTARGSETWISHVTAAQLYGLAMPQGLVDPDIIHISNPHAVCLSDSDPRVCLHRVAPREGDVRLFRGVRVSSPARLFVEVSGRLPLKDRVILGDQLVRQPRLGLEGRIRPWVSLEELAQGVVVANRGRRGAPQAREALDLIRVGADSPPETLLRLAIVRAGLPEPELQLRIDPSDPYSPAGDMGYRQQRIVLQYEGEHHFTAEQQARDERRNAIFWEAGWSVIRANRVDLREGFAGLVRRLALALSRAQP